MDDMDCSCGAKILSELIPPPAADGPGVRPARAHVAYLSTELARRPPGARKQHCSLLLPWCRRRARAPFGPWTQVEARVA